MAAKNWRDNSDSTGKQANIRTPPSASPSEPVRLGPFVRAVSLVLVAVALAFCVKLVWDYIHPNRKTAIYLLNRSDAQFTADPYSGALFLDESLEQLRSPNENLAQQLELDSTTHMLGPLDDTVLVYLYGDLSSDADGQLLISQNQADQNEFSSTSWTPLRERLKRICESSISTKQSSLNRVVLLDVGFADESVRFGTRSLSERVKNLLAELKSAEVVNHNRLWVIVSADGLQRSWYAPELGSSVFSFFVAQGLAGWAVPEDDDQISLQQLFDYVQDSVGRWVRDNRDSTQVPQLISVNESADAEKLSVIYSSRKHKPPSGKISEYRKSDPDVLWEKLAKLDSTHAHLPQQLGMVRARLVRLEELRYGATQDDFRSQIIFKKLKLSIDNLIGSLPVQASSSGTAVSMGEVDVSAFTESAFGGGSPLQNSLRNYLFPQPDGTAPGSSEPPAQPGSESAAGDQAAPPPIATAKAPELSEQLKKLNKLNRLKLVWEYLGSVIAVTDPMSGDDLARCVAFVTEGAGEFGPQVDGKRVDLAELQFLRILSENIDWFSAGSIEYKSQMRAVLTAIQCRQASDNVIQGSGFNSHRHSRTWPVIREEFDRLEARRRAAEDDLLANLTDSAQTELDQLNSEFNALHQHQSQIIRLTENAEDVIEMVPYLRSFLLRESALREINPTIVQQLELLNSLQRDAISSFQQLRQADIGRDAVSESLQRLDGIEDLRQQFRQTYEQLLISDQKSASNVVFHALNILASPIPEWLAQGKPSSRKSIRGNLDKWIELQRETLLSEWAAFQDKNEMQAVRQTISLDDYQRLAVPPKHEFVDLRFETPSGRSSALADIGMRLNQLKPGSQIFDQNFDFKGQSIEDVAGLAEWQTRLGTLDFEIRMANELLSYHDQPLDVGQQLATIDQLVLASDQMRRVASDFWGNGEVEEIVNQAGLPPFIQYATARRGNLDTQLNTLAAYKSRSDFTKTAFEIEQLRSSLDQRLQQSRQSWTDLQTTRITWPNQPPSFLPDTDLVVETQLNSDFKPHEVGVADSVTFASRMTVNSEPWQRTVAVEFGTPPAQIPWSRVSADQERQKKISLETTLGFRGHRFVSPFRVVRGVVERPDIVVFESNHTQPDPGPSHVTVLNSAEYRADVVFILDCSKSMRKGGIVGRKTELEGDTTATRFEFAKQALDSAIRELYDENRFRMGLYAFGHRADFKFVPSTRDKTKMVLVPDKITGRYPLDLNTPNGVHPFNDCQPLYHLASNRGAVADVGDRNSILAEIDKLKLRGITPLYYSIQLAAENEFTEEVGNRKRYIVVLTDGENVQIETERAAGLPVGKKVSDATTVSQVAQTISQKGITLLVARMSESGTETDSKLAQAGDRILSVAENDSVKISEAILDAIGQNQYALTKAGDDVERKVKIAPQNKISTKEQGDFVVQTFGVEKEDAFGISLQGDESVFLKNTVNGLALIDPNPEFMSDFGGPNGAIKTDFGPGRTYQVGRIKPNSENELAFGFYKTVSVAGADSRNFSFRPQRVWAQVTDKKTGITTDLFLPNFDPGKFPVVRFRLPQRLTNMSDQIDVRIWVTPHPRDGWAEISDPLAKNQIGPNQSTVSGVDINRTDDEANATTTVELNPDDDPREYFVNCPASQRFTQSVTFENGKRKKERYEFKVPSNEANLSLSILPREQYNAIMERVGAAAERVGKDKDPIFGDDAIWINFPSVNIK